MTNSSKWHGRLVFLLAVAVFIFSFSFSIRGSHWRYRLHPDEHLVADWQNDAMLYPAGMPPGVIGAIALYPQGYFRMSVVYTFVANLVDYCQLSFKKFQEKISDGITQDGPSSRSISEIYLKNAAKHDINESTRYQNKPFLLRPRTESLLAGRHLNAILAGITAVLFFLAVFAATNSIFGALSAGILCGTTPYLIEHAHYCETDVGVAAMFALSVFAAMSAVKKENMWLMCPFAACCAAAFATKYSVAFLAPYYCLIFCYLAVFKYRQQDNSVGKRTLLKKILAAGMLSIVCGIAAYMLFTPVSYVAPEKLLTMFVKVDTRVNSGTTSDLIHEPVDVWLRQKYIIASIWHFLKEFGIVQYALLAIVMPFLVNFRKNRCGLFLIILPFLYFVVAVAKYPWIRSQEFLLVALMLNVMIAMGIGIADEVMRNNKRARGLRLCVPVFSIICLLVSLNGAGYMTKAFTWQDSCITMRKWLEMCANPESRFASERFASQTVKSDRIRTAAVFNEAEATWNPTAIDVGDPGHEYFVRNATHDGRNHRSPITGKLYPYFQDGLDNFKSHAILLKTVDMLPEIRPTFAQIAMELWGIVPTNAVLRTPDPLATRAEMFYFGGETYYYVRGNDFIGPAESIRTVGKRSRVRMTPPGKGKPLFAVTRHITGEVPAKIKWEALFEPREKTILPGKADWFILPAKMANRAFMDTVPHTKVRMRGNDQTSLCLTTVTDNPAYAAELLVRGGSPDKAAELLSSVGFHGGLNEAIGEMAQKLPERMYNDFSRLYLGSFKVIGVLTTQENSITADDDPLDAAKNTYENKENPSADTGMAVRDIDGEFPILLNPGRYNVRLTIRENKFRAPVTDIKLYGDGVTVENFNGNLKEDGTPVSFSLVVKKTVFPHIHVTLGADGTTDVFVDDFEITW